MASRGRRSIGRGAAIRVMLCLVLVWAPAGCRSVYRLHCTSDPTPAGVLLGEDFLGETECTVKVPKDSEWIHDGQIELTFALPNGQEQTCVVDLRGCEPSNPLAEIVAWPFLIGGVGLVALSHDSDEDDEDASFFDDDDDDDNEDRERTWLGVGAIIVGAGLYHLFGGDLDSLDPCPVHVDFNVSGEGQ